MPLVCLCAMLCYQHKKSLSLTCQTAFQLDLTELMRCNVIKYSFKIKHLCFVLLKNKFSAKFKSHDKVTIEYILKHQIREKQWPSHITVHVFLLHQQHPGFLGGGLSPTGFAAQDWVWIGLSPLVYAAIVFSKDGRSSSTLLLFH